MAGFGKITVVGEHFTNKVVNVFNFRSNTVEWLVDNPFESMLAVVQQWWGIVEAEWLSLNTTDTRVLHVEGVAYDDNYAIVTPSPVVHTVNKVGTWGVTETTGSFVASVLSYMLGPQQQINLIGQAKRNRGYTCFGPVNEASVDNYGHFSETYVSKLNTLAQLLDDKFTNVGLASEFVPVRIHEKWLKTVKPLPNILLWRTYSDVLGYKLPRMATTRRSRRGEA
jgi:hypothetical protein